MSIANLRQEYQLAGLRRADLAADPIEQFQVWFDAALKAGVREPNAMTLATVDTKGAPAARIVLLKAVDKRGFSFFTNYHSAKARELEAYAQAALVFHWHDLERQVRVTGTVEKLPLTEADEYFSQRPRGSQLGAWASEQSSVVTSRAALESKLAHHEEKFRDQPVPRPEHWGGFLVKPNAIEFWQGRPNRLHDRFNYSIQADGLWKIERLSP